jgi:outer membrane protein assembly factor BamB
MRQMLVCLLVLGSTPLAAKAQLRPTTTLVSPEAARQLGLERIWFTQLHLDRSRGRMGGLHMHVSATEAHTVFQFTDGGKRYVFSQRDRDAFGLEIGIDGAKQRAEEKQADIKKALELAGQADAQPPAIETIVVPKITFYATSERGLVHALDGETGKTLWTTSLGNPRYPTTNAAANDKFVGVCNGSTLYVLLASDGSLVWTRSAISSPGAGPALSTDLIFVPMVTGQIESFLLEDPSRPVKIYQSFGRAMVQPVVSANSVAWPTDKGNLYVGMANDSGVRFRMQAGDAIVSAPAFLEPDKVFVTSLDGYLYCVSEARGNMVWRFTTGEPISHSPVVLGESVYAITDRGNLFAIDANTAQEQWMTPNIRRYIAGNDQRLYCLDPRGDLVVLDRATGSLVGTIAAGQLDVPILNTQTDRIILASATGLVQCFRESSRPWPTVHYLIEAPQRDAKPATSEAPKPAEEKSEAAPKTENDPFGAPANDPFGAPAPANPAPPAADPFG